MEDILTPRANDETLTNKLMKIYIVCIIKIIYFLRRIRKSNQSHFITLMYFTIYLSNNTNGMCEFLHYGASALTVSLLPFDRFRYL